MALVSVVIPTYNRAMVIGKTIQSVLDQSFQDFEIIVVDDGSIDQTKKIVEHFKSDKIKYFFQENKGAQVARNNGMSMATGEYIAFLDSDDIWLPTFLEELLPEFTDDDIGCVYCTKAIKKANGDIISAKKKYLSGWVYKEALEQKYIASPSFMLVSRECMNKIGEWDVSFPACQDDDFCLRIAKHCKIKYKPKVLALYCDDYFGSDNRICKSSRNLACGGWLLCEKFQDDILKFCGRKTLVLHYLECANSFFEVGMSNEGDAAIQKAISYYGSRGSLRKDFEREIVDFVSSGNIYCYGAGEIGALVAGYIKKNRHQIKAFIVTKKSSNTLCCGYPVMTVDDVKVDNCKIIISTTEKYHPEIEGKIKEIIGDVPILKVSKEFRDYLEISRYLWEG